MTRLVVGLTNRLADQHTSGSRARAARQLGNVLRDHGLDLRAQGVHSPDADLIWFSCELPGPDHLPNTTVDDLLEIPGVESAYIVSTDEPPGL